MDEVLATQTSQDAFLEFTRCYGLKAVYLSVGPLVWMEGGAVHNHPNLPGFLSRLYNNGVRVDALLGGKVYADIDDALAAVLAYNDSRDDAHGFQGIHLDLEPWIGTEGKPNESTWVDPLIATYQQVGRQAAAQSLPVVGDVSGSKMLASYVTTPQRQAMLDAVVRLVLMQYEVDGDLAVVVDRAQRFMAGVTPSSNHGILVGIRAIDFPPPVKSELAELDVELGGRSYYRGWAVYDHAAAVTSEQVSSLPNCDL
jgi:hypothetical protein